MASYGKEGPGGLSAEMLLPDGLQQYAQAYDAEMQQARRVCLGTAMPRKDAVRQERSSMHICSSLTQVAVA